MEAPFRIHKPVPSGTQKTGATKVQDDLASWMGRLIRLIPSEIVAIYLTGKGFIASWLPIWSFICLLLLFIVRIWGTRDTHKTNSVQWIAVGVSAISYVIWIYAIGGQFFNFAIQDPSIPSAAVLIWTFLVSYFYKGD
jgi:hypothetical protein